MPFKNDETQKWFFSRMERMGAYQCATGFKPIGAHTSLVHQLLGSFTQICQRCGGEGILTTENGGWEFCSICEGSCTVFSGTNVEYEESLQQVLSQYPDAAASKRTT